MSLQAGSRIGPYEIVAPLGAGGMGEVYRARDKRLDRDVALKVLPDSFAADVERVARFEREAKTLASLNHPNIAQIFGLEGLDRRDGQDARALVMELVEGQDLSDLIAAPMSPIGAPGPAGPGLHVNDAFAIAKQIAEALEAAHEHGIIHRDLKPANVKVRADGTVKVLDFGLAKAIEGAGGAGRAGGEAGGLSLSPTLSLHATQAGIILGTAAYMAPEQARGKPVDKRADIWAFGIVLYEMLTGRRAFIGDDASLTLAAVMMNEPDWTAVPAAVPAAAVRLMRRCLVKDPKRRLRDIGEARLQIDELLSGNMDASTTSAAMAAAAMPASPRSRTIATLAPWIPWTIALGLAVSLVGTLSRATSPRPPAAPVRANIAIGADASIRQSQGTGAVLSPSGAILAFAARADGAERFSLFVRRLDQLKAIALPGTEGAASPFFSPDSQWIAFFADSKLKKVSVGGGSVTTLCDAPDRGQGDWTAGDAILFTGATGNIERVPAAGGEPKPLIPLGKEENAQRWPQLLGDGAVLFTSAMWFTNWDDAVVVAQALPDGARTIVMRGGYAARYLPSGHLVYMHSGTLFAAPFDVRRLALTGPAVPVVESVVSNPIAGNVSLAASASGTLVYREGATTGSGVPAPIQWLDKSGATLLRKTPSAWGTPRFSPDGRQIAFAIESRAAGKGLVSNIWVYEWERDTLTRLTTGDFRDVMPVWTPDSKRIAFASTRDGAVSNMYWIRADGAGEAQRLTTSTIPQMPDSFHPGHPGGRLLAFHQGNPVAAEQSLMMLPIEGSEAEGWKPGTPTLFLGGGGLKAFAEFSPDGRWLSYSSMESGNFEIYVRPYPGPGGKWQISSGGGNVSMWSRTRSELFFTGSAAVRQVMVVPYTASADAFHAGKPELWSEARTTNSPFSTNYGWQMDLHPDGKRFAVAMAPDTAAQAKADHVVLVTNFLDELRRLAPASNK